MWLFTLPAGVGTLEFGQCSLFINNESPLCCTENGLLSIGDVPNVLMAFISVDLLALEA